MYKARDPRLDRIVAIKRLTGRHNARFEREARAIAALNHAHICQVFLAAPIESPEFRQAKDRTVRFA